MSQLSRRQVLVGLSSAGITTLLAGGRVVRDPFLSGDGGYNCYRTPGLAISKLGTVLAFCGGRVDNCRDEGNIDVVLRRSSDGGSNWRVGAVAGFSPSSESTVAELGDGSLMLNSRSNGGQRIVSISRDGGLSMASSWSRGPAFARPETTSATAASHSNGFPST